MEDGQGSRERRWYLYVTHHHPSLVVLEEQLAWNVGLHSTFSPSCCLWFSSELELLLKVWFSGDLGKGNSSLCETVLIAGGKTGYFTVCLDLKMIPVLLVKQSNNRMSGLWFPPKRGNGERHLTWNMYPSCEKPHTRYTTNMMHPNFVLVTGFTSNVQLITFLNERGKILTLRFEGHFTTHVTEGVRMI